RGWVVVADAELLRPLAELLELLRQDREGEARLDLGRHFRVGLWASAAVSCCRHGGSPFRRNGSKSRSTLYLRKSTTVKHRKSKRAGDADITMSTKMSNFVKNMASSSRRGAVSFSCGKYGRANVAGSRAHAHFCDNR